VIGSFRNSGNAFLLVQYFRHPRGVHNLKTLNCTASGVSVKVFPSALLPLGG